MFKITDEISDILDLGYSLATERYYFRLFDLIMDGCIKFTGADGGDFYVVDDAGFRRLISINKSMGYYVARGDETREEDSLPDSLIYQTATKRKIINIEDIYEETGYNTEQIKEFDRLNKYRTKSMLAIPIFEPGKQVIGVMILFNCKDDDQKVVPFPEAYEAMVNSLCSQMAIALTNMSLIQELEELLMSFVAAMTTAIDARTPYNANHTVHVAEYCMEIVDYINALHTRGEYDVYITESDREQLYMAALLHDLGKMITPREVLNKATRLGVMYDSLVNKLEKIQLMMRIDNLEGRKEDAEWAIDNLRLTNFIAELPELNYKEFLSKEDMERIQFISNQVYVDTSGRIIPYLDEEEIKALSIGKGTLTAEERLIMEQHVVYTDKMLEQIKFNDRYAKVRRIASNHHEYLNGTGYPNHIGAQDIDMLTRLLTIIDIYDSLTANDRPYKGTVPVKRALAILDEMATEGKLDKSLVRIVRDYMLSKLKNSEKD